MKEVRLCENCVPLLASTRTLGEIRPLLCPACKTGVALASFSEKASKLRVDLTPKELELVGRRRRGVK